MAVTHSWAMRCPVYRQRDFHLGFDTELENGIGGGKGKGTSSSSARPKVPIGRSGRDCLVVAWKRGNACGAKGAGHWRQDRWVNRQREEPTGGGGGRQPSLDGTSREGRLSRTVLRASGCKSPGRLGGSWQPLSLPRPSAHGSRRPDPIRDAFGYQRASVPSLPNCFFGPITGASQHRHAAEKIEGLIVVS
jgi:hypothetical protein